MPQNAGDPPHLALGIAREPRVVHVEDAAGIARAPVRHQAPVLAVVIGQFQLVVGVRIGIGEQFAQVREAGLHRVAHHVQDPACGKARQMKPMLRKLDGSLSMKQRLAAQPPAMPSR